MIAIDRWTPSPPTALPPAPGGLHLWLIDLAGPAAADPLPLSRDERQRCEGIASATGRGRCIAVRSALRRILAGYLGQDAAALGFRYGPSGKPELEPGSPLGFNLTHSADLALLAVTQDTAVGIDLEPDRERPAARAIARRIFPEKVADDLASLTGDRFREAFLVQWTAWEARVKLEGGSLFRPPSGAAGVAHLRPRSGWLAAVAMDPGPPPPAQWRTFLYHEGAA